MAGAAVDPNDGGAAGKLGGLPRAEGLVLLPTVAGLGGSADDDAAAAQLYHGVLGGDAAGTPLLAAPPLADWALRRL